MKLRSAAQSFSPKSQKFPLLLLLTLLALSLAAAGCGKKNANGNSNSADDDPTAQAPYTKGVVPQPDTDVAVINVESGPWSGKIVLELYPNVAPKMVAQFKKLIGQGFYNGSTFHRVDPELGIIQGGDPLSKDADPTNDGNGKSDEPNVPSEFSDLPFEVGTLGAARNGGGQNGLTEKQSWDTSNCQFFIMTAKQPQFDRRYIVFGKVIAGQNDAAIVGMAPTAPGNRPYENFVMKSVTLEPRSNYIK